jgi:hypothetical protein
VCCISEFPLGIQRVIKRHSSKMSTNLTIPQHSCQLYVSMGSLSSSGISITKLFSKVNFRVQQGYFQNHYTLKMTCAQNCKVDAGILSELSKSYARPLKLGLFCHSSLSPHNQYHTHARLILYMINFLQTLYKKFKN